MNITKPQIIVGISGASGAAYGVTVLKLLKATRAFDTHLVVSEIGKQTTALETGLSEKDLMLLADHTYDIRDMNAPIASGSFRSIGMIVAPCSMRSLAAIAHSFCDNLLTRAADVVLKERRRLVLLARETPLTIAHLKNMQSVSEMGGIIYPPVPAFYNKPNTLEQVIEQTANRALELFDIYNENTFRWNS